MIQTINKINASYAGHNRLNTIDYQLTTINMQNEANLHSRNTQYDIRNTRKRTQFQHSPNVKTIEDHKNARKFYYQLLLKKRALYTSFNRRKRAFLPTFLHFSSCFSFFQFLHKMTLTPCISKTYKTFRPKTQATSDANFTCLK
jgi:hypothetical protein